ncbi:hypothetical protein BJ508DRAFT_324449 [Ascobolus immersus RN42]|uniref:Uncharacterized protein n=1 Tax=Ascobolus immersus RN42 TaxID=1160509 RepID=A0A3N4IBF0_ASCIM|nr:hypothetical protein BJ508DRAFT_324449 [Ascobolus immersus RN42]
MSPFNLVFLADFSTVPSDTLRFPEEWSLSIPSPLEPASLGPFTPVDGSSAIYALFRGPGPDLTLRTLCAHLPISEPIPNPDDPDGVETLVLVAAHIDSGGIVWGRCDWSADPDVPGAVVGNFTYMLGFGSRPEDHAIVDILFGLQSPPETVSLLRPTLDYASLDIDHAQSPRRYPRTRATATSDSGAVTYMFYDRMNDESAPLVRPYAGMHVVFRDEASVDERATPIMITEVMQPGDDFDRKFRGWINGGEIDVFLGRVRDGFAGTIIEAHPGVLPSGTPCVSGLVSFRKLKM